MMTLRTGSAAVAWAANQHNHPMMSWVNRCLKFSRMCNNVGSKYYDARTAYLHTTKRHTSSTPPPGVPVWWLENHVAHSAGGGYVWSNDILHPGKIDKVPISLITRNWGMTYKGWSEDINGVDVYPNVLKPVTHPDAVSLSQAIEAARRDHYRPQGSGTHENNTMLIERALMREGLLDTRYANDGYWGTITLAAYARLQKRSGVGGPYDGIPGIQSLRWLGNRHNMRIAA